MNKETVATYRESADVLDELAVVGGELNRVKALTETRNRLMVRARALGIPWDRVADAAGMSRQAAMTAVQRIKDV